VGSINNVTLISILDKIGAKLSRVGSLNLRGKIEEIMCLNHGPPFHIIRNQWIELKTTNPH
jgi:hypothetical protein